MPVLCGVKKRIGVVVLAFCHRIVLHLWGLWAAAILVSRSCWRGWVLHCRSPTQCSFFRVCFCRWPMANKEQIQKKLVSKKKIIEAEMEKLELFQEDFETHFLTNVEFIKQTSVARPMLRFWVRIICVSFLISMVFMHLLVSRTHFVIFLLHF